MSVLPSLTIHRHDRGHHTMITLAGEIDLNVTAGLHMTVEDCLREGIRTIDIDLTVLDFCDVSGLNAFLAVAERTASLGGFLRLRHPRPAIARLLELSGTGFLLRSPPSAGERQPASDPAAERRPASDPVAAAYPGLLTP
ncbi:STAS domain-containing protein [Streptomyces sp. NBC_01477]|uniref:STAS domain-containing protein n=1 Tax=Streptomyces sp. NBC_01477 TaxID=2976015 RepID=UPI003FCC8732